MSSDFLRSAGQREYRFAVPAYAIEEHAPPTMLRRARAQAMKGLSPPLGGRQAPVTTPPVTFDAALPF
ncbi:hypothetical protein C8R44DRAFT_885779 [Mycena epipterygia]|nr:hypothetical protein C8R44DRAFT_885779 [Mycena epipterygia]